MWGQIGTGQCPKRGGMLRTKLATLQSRHPAFFLKRNFYVVAGFQLSHGVTLTLTPKFQKFCGIHCTFPHLPRLLPPMCLVSHLVKQIGNKLLLLLPI